MDNNNPGKLYFIDRVTQKRKEITCYPNDTYFILKRKLGSEIDTDERQIQFFDERVMILNNNQFVRYNLQTIYYEIVDMPMDDIVLEIKNNHFGIPRWMQINRTVTIGDLKDQISNFQQTGLVTFLFNEKSEELKDDNRTIESYELINGSKIKIWRGENLKVTMKFYINFNNEIRNNLIFSMTDSIGEVKKIILNEKICPGNPEKIALITDSSYWQDDKLLIDYPIKQEGTAVFVVDLKKDPGITIGKQVDKGNYARIFDATDGLGNIIRVNRYNTNNEVVNKNRILKYAIISHTLLNGINVNKFVQMIAMYEKDKYFYIATEYMKRDSLKAMYDQGLSFSNRDIIHYSIQICQALDYMHSNKFMHRNLNCSSVLVDDGNNIKLTNFHLSKYLFNATSEQLLAGIPGSRIEISKCWLAPEVLRNDPYGLKSDIWSLAVTVLEMFTHNRPYPEMNVLRATHRIVTENTIHYDRNLIPEYFHNFLDLCLRVPQWERPSAKQCIQLLEAFPSVNN